jgi:hypothetical protein
MNYQLGWIAGQSLVFNNRIYNYGYVRDNSYKVIGYINSIDKNGNLIFEKYFNIGVNFEIRKIIESNRKLYAVGLLDTLSDIGISKRCAFLCELDPQSGNIKWFQIYSHGIYSEIHDIKEFRNGLIMCGQAVNENRKDEFDSIGYIEGDSWVLIVDSLGCIKPGCEPNYLISVPESGLKENSIKIYPNPAIDQLNIQFLTPFEVNAPISVSIFDEIGRKIYYLERTNMNDLTIDFQQQIHGLIYVLIQTDFGSITRKIIFK